ncbi:RecQ-mediated genome instability protein 1 [Rhynchospora pubera]|uniref:RecQ-mediated genome instability protein 1 n=1 Tax=Rhynchospora pubera TaxID=906938 RepID=A0AAV8D5Q4_9POAL|nr:RecQ-mediated genome instability protein 1 [Rhynchospora pubera]
MRRRRLCVVISDDEQDDDTTAASPPPIPSINAYSNPSSPLVISDEDQEDFVTVPDDLSTPSPPSISSPLAASTFHAQNANSDSRIAPIDQFLRRLGLCLRHEWLEVCSDGISSTVHGHDGFDDETKAKKIFEQFLFADLNEIGAGVLPENVGMMHKTELQGPFVLQVDEMVNISAPIKERYQNSPAGPKRCLKLSMTDGVQRVFGIEYRPIKELEVLAPSGFKVVVRNVQVRRGLLMLVPEILSVLGGIVDDLDQARQRLVSEVNKPPRGKRKHGGIPLSGRASLAAWSSDIGTGMTDVNAQSNLTVNPAPQRANAAQLTQPARSPATASGFTFGVRNTDPDRAQEITMEAVNNSNEESSSVNQHRDSQQLHIGGPHVIGISAVNYSHEPSFMNEEPSANHERHAEQFLGGGNPHVVGQSITSTNEEHSPTDRRSYLVPLCGGGSPRISGRNITIEENDMVVDEDPPPVNNRRDSEQVECLEPLFSDRSTTTQGNDMVDVDEDDDTMMDLVGDGASNDKLQMKNSPSTYMSSLQAQWDKEESQTEHSIRGRIKCFLTGVKGKFGFQGKFDLQAYIDDGSLISLVKIDHNVIQERIGHTPEEVVAALKLPDTKMEDDMRQTMRNFQDFLRQFEGTVLLEINETSDLPIAIEMNQGCSSGDANLLLKRLKAMEQ